MKTCRNCGTELSDEANFCHVCGASDTAREDSRAVRKLNQQGLMSRTVFHVLMLALTLMGMVVVGKTS